MLNGVLTEYALGSHNPRQHVLKKSFVPLQLIICVVFFIALLSVLGSRMPAAWDFDIEGVFFPLEVLHHVCPRCAYRPPSPYKKRLHTLCVSLHPVSMSSFCIHTALAPKVSRAIARVCSKLSACFLSALHVSHGCCLMCAGSCQMPVQPQPPTYQTCAVMGGAQLANGNLGNLDKAQFAFKPANCSYSSESCA